VDKFLLWAWGHDTRTRPASLPSLFMGGIEGGYKGKFCTSLLQNGAFHITRTYIREIYTYSERRKKIRGEKEDINKEEKEKREREEKEKR